MKVTLLSWLKNIQADFYLVHVVLIIIIKARYTYLYPSSIWQDPSSTTWQQNAYRMSPKHSRDTNTDPINLLMK